MPTTIYLRGGVKFLLRGDGPGTVIKRLFRPMATGIAMNGRLVEFRWRERLFIEPQPEAEFQAELAAQAKNAEAQALAQKEAQEKAEKDKDASLKVAAEAFIAKHGPDEENWPEALRTKNPAPGEPLRDQVDRLAKFIMAEIPGEPSKDEGAIDTAIRIIRSSRKPAAN